MIAISLGLFCIKVAASISCVTLSKRSEVNTWNWLADSIRVDWLSSLTYLRIVSYTFELLMNYTKLSPHSHRYLSGSFPLKLDSKPFATIEITGHTLRLFFDFFVNNTCFYDM